MTTEDILPDDPTAYQTQEYWDQRYTKEKTFDWFKTWKDLQPVLEPIICDYDAKIIILGCGNSTLGPDMYASNYHNITNIDFSPIVIENMKSEYSTLSSMKWEVMDIRDIKYGNETFDIAIDKGTMDAMMCEKGSIWSPSEALKQNVALEVDEVLRILKPNGKFIYVTFGQPHFRRQHLERAGLWDVEVKKIGDSFHYYVYVMKKKGNDEK
ncbi:S-adenosyl-L-methionine-dependent methyltransferase [Paraphysoderma sedebokerense]|nr:S-adenosyl-L-methionine-dependent methyltransferase [Paraphysoderma sedebokerense]